MLNVTKKVERFVRYQILFPCTFKTKCIFSNKSNENFIISTQNFIKFEQGDAEPCITPGNPYKIIRNTFFFQFLIANNFRRCFSIQLKMTSWTFSTDLNLFMCIQRLSELHKEVLYKES